jgi:hypothetical protein
VFEKLARGEMAALGAGGLPLLVIQHPLGGETPEGVSRRVAQAEEQLARLLVARRPSDVASVAVSPERST